MNELEFESHCGSVAFNETDRGLRVSVWEEYSGFGSVDFYMTDEQVEKLFSYLNLYLLEKEQDESAD